MCMRESAVKSETAQKVFYRDSQYDCWIYDRNHLRKIVKTKDGVLSIEFEFIIQLEDPLSAH